MVVWQMAIYSNGASFPNSTVDGTRIVRKTVVGACNPREDAAHFPGDVALCAARCGCAGTVIDGFSPLLSVRTAASKAGNAAARTANTLITKHATKHAS